MNVVSSNTVQTACSASKDPEQNTRHPQPTDSDYILSYYSSAHAGQSYSPEGFAPRTPSRSRTNSSASSTYSLPEPTLENNPSNNVLLDVSSPAALPIQRRPSNNSSSQQSDRRVAVVEMDQDSFDVLDDSFKQHSALLARRGLDGYHIGRLALMTAPDATPASASLQPPLSAPITADHNNSSGGLQISPVDARVGSHQRSHSEAVKLGRLQKKSSRDVGIVGTTPTSPIRMSDSRNRPFASPTDPSPIFQTPSPSKPFNTNFQRTHSAVDAHEKEPRPNQLAQSAHQSESDRTLAPAPSIRTAWSASPSVGKQATDNGPSSASILSGISSPYLHYQPGLHATAGPLPEPPRPVLNPSTNFHAVKPSKMQAAMLADRASLKHSLKLPDTVTAALAKRANGAPEVRDQVPGVESRSNSLRDVSPETRRESHSREAATTETSSSEASVHSSDTAADHEQEEQTTVSITTTSVEDGNDDDRASESTCRTSLSREDMTGIGSQAHLLGSHQRVDHGGQLDVKHAKQSSSSLNVSKALPDPKASESELNTQPSGNTGLRPLDMKRFSSLPRTPSIASTSTSSFYADHLRDGTSHRQRGQKKKSIDPDVMGFADVLELRTAHERARAYARKIAGFKEYYSGLVDWVGDTKRNLINPPRVHKRDSASSEIGAFDMKTRQSSRNSISSEVTFPRRMDAYSATDLSKRPSMEHLSEGPALPYPALAQVQTSRVVPTGKGLAGFAANLSPSSLGPARALGGVFANIGRKASLRRQQSISDTPLPQPRLLSRRANAAPAPRSIQLDSTPTIVGGPRAPPGRSLRSQHTATPAPSAPERAATPTQSALSTPPTAVKRNSFVPPPRATSPIKDETVFKEQLQKLANALPHADEKVLAGYLRRSGQHIAAVGQYLNDERNGTIQTG